MPGEAGGSDDDADQHEHMDAFEARLAKNRKQREDEAATVAENPVGREETILINEAVSVEEQEGSDEEDVTLKSGLGSNATGTGTAPSGAGGEAEGDTTVMGAPVEEIEGQTGENWRILMEEADEVFLKISSMSGGENDGRSTLSKEELAAAHGGDFGLFEKAELVDLVPRTLFSRPQTLIFLFLEQVLGQIKSSVEFARFAVLTNVCTFALVQKVHTLGMWTESLFRLDGRLI